MSGHWACLILGCVEVGDEMVPSGIGICFVVSPYHMGCLYSLRISEIENLPPNFLFSK